jgi:glycosyltransferase involved in cell wall biosynthesis
MNLHEYYGRSSVLVLPSLADSYGLVALEAMACATPLIVSSNTGMASIISQGMEGFVVPIRDVETIKERLRWLYENSDAAVEMGRAASRLVSHLSWEEYGRRSVSVYKQILTGVPQTQSWAKPA